MIDEQEALQIGSIAARESGCIWTGVTSAMLRRPWFGRGHPWWVVESNVGVAGGAKFWAKIDAETGEVLETGYVDR